jgi:hypothetical protein
VSAYQRAMGLGLDPTKVSAARQQIVLLNREVGFAA